MPRAIGASIATRLIRSGESMKVRILRDGAFKAGEVVDLHDSVAGKWIASGLAEAVEKKHVQPAPAGDETPVHKAGAIYPLNKRKKV